MEEREKSKGRSKEKVISLDEGDTVWREGNAGQGGDLEGSLEILLQYSFRLKIVEFIANFSQ